MHGLVVEACIGFSAGDTDSGSSRNCRRILKLILDSGTEIILCPLLWEEWERHAKSIGLIFLRKMVIARKARRIASCPHSELRENIRNMNDQSRRGAMEKDAHLVEASLGWGKRILSADRKARGHFVYLGATCPVLICVYWAHLDRENADEGISKWITEKLPENTMFLLFETQPPLLFGANAVP